MSPALLPSHTSRWLPCLSLVAEPDPSDSKLDGDDTGAIAVGADGSTTADVGGDAAGHDGSGAAASAPNSRPGTSLSRPRSTLPTRRVSAGAAGTSSSSPSLALGGKTAVERAAQKELEVCYWLGSSEEEEGGGGGGQRAGYAVTCVMHTRRQCGSLSASLCLAHPGSVAGVPREAEEERGSEGICVQPNWHRPIAHVRNRCLWYSCDGERSWHAPLCFRCLLRWVSGCDGCCDSRALDRLHNPFTPAQKLLAEKLARLEEEEEKARAAEAHEAFLAWKRQKAEEKRAHREPPQARQRSEND